MLLYISVGCQLHTTSASDLIPLLKMFWKTVAVALLAGIAAAARLEKGYLPPAGAAYSGGTGGVGGIAAPFAGGYYAGAGGFGGRFGSASRFGAGAIRPGAVYGGVAGIGGGYSGPAGFGGVRGGYAGFGGVGAGYAGGVGAAGGYTGTGVYNGGVGGPIIPIVSYDNNPNQGDGSYSYSYVTANEIRAQEEGFLDASAPEGPGEAARGSFSYVAPDGQQISLSYTADGNGFNPQGAHLPTPPPIPPEILESLEKNAADEAAGIFDDGSYRGEGAEEGVYKGVGSGYVRPGGYRGAGGYRGPGRFGSAVGAYGGFGAGTAGYGSALGYGGAGGIGAAAGYGSGAKLGAGAYKGAVGAGGVSGSAAAGGASFAEGYDFAGSGGYQQGGESGYSYPKPSK